MALNKKDTIIFLKLKKYNVYKPPCTNGKSGGSYSDTKIDRIGATRPKQFNPGKNDTRGGFGEGEIEGG